MKRLLTIALVIAFCAFAGSAYAGNFRLDVGAGPSFGSISVDEDIEDVSVDADLGFGDGYTLGIRFWEDGLIFYKNLSLGLEYEYRNLSDNVEVSDGGDEEDLSLDLSSQTVFVNVALRRNSGDVHPYVGFGLGMGRFSLEAEMDDDSEDDSFTALVVQGIVGCDVDLSPNWYIGADAKYGYTNGSLFDVDASYYVLSVLFRVGFKF